MKKVIPIVSGRSAAPTFSGGALVDTRARPMRDLRGGLRGRFPLVGGFLLFLSE